MDIQKIFEAHTIKAKEYIRLQNTGMTAMAAAYMVYGAEVGDQIVKLQQDEIIMNFKNALDEPKNPKI